MMCIMFMMAIPTIMNRRVDHPMSSAELNALLTRATRARDALRSALAQSLPSDDPIIMSKVEAAEMLIDSIADMLKAARSRLQTEVRL
jgi:hypothetical protein